MSDREEGTVLQNRYRLIAKLGAGAMGAVYKAADTRLNNTPVAIKETFANNHVERRLFEREAAVLKKLNHRALPRVWGYFAEEDGQFLVMDFIEGESLDKMLERQGAGLDFSLVMNWAGALLDTLSYIHAQEPPIIHRDIKPANISLTPRGEIFLLDFGLARDTLEPSNTTKNYVLGTRAYAPPEQLRRLREGERVDARSDLYALGATLYHLLTGQPPDQADIREQRLKYAMPDPLRPAHEINPQIPFALAHVVARAMAVESARRFASAAEMSSELQQAHDSIIQRHREETEILRLQEEARQRQLEELHQQEAAEQRRREQAAQQAAEHQRQEEEAAERRQLEEAERQQREALERELAEQTRLKAEAEQTRLRAEAERNQREEAERHQREEAERKQIEEAEHRWRAVVELESAEQRRDAEELREPSNLSLVPRPFARGKPLAIVLGVILLVSIGYWLEYRSSKPSPPIPTSPTRQPETSPTITPLPTTDPPESIRIQVRSLYENATKLYQQGQYERAIGECDKAIKLDPNNKEVNRLQVRSLYANATRLYKQRQDERAIGECDKALKLDPNNKEVNRLKKNIMGTKRILGSR